MLRRPVLVLAVALTAALLTAPAALGEQVIAADGRDNTVVIAVVDSGFQPQHWNFHASRMPQHLDDDPSNDLPLDEAPDTWLPGFSTAGLASFNRLGLALDDANAGRSVSSLQAASPWSSVRQSSASSVHYYWVPDSKVVGIVRFGSGAVQGGNTAHGAGTSSVSAGNLHGTCPECVVVLVTYGGNDREAASNWAMRQPWIDVVTNSFGFSQVERERLYSGSDTDLQRQASERGQTIFFSSGNGISNTFSVPNTTLFSSQEGPDWIVTVGAVSPTGGEYTGAGKPADVASVGLNYPSQGGSTVSSSGTFGGTSNATPVVAGMYARALYRAREALRGGRTQESGVIGRGAPVECGAARPECELGDGELTATELRTRFFHGAVRTPQGLHPTLYGTDTPAKTDETELMSEGHGTYFGRMKGAEHWAAEEQRIFGPMDGTAAALTRTNDEREWMIVDSYCRQEIWGQWSGGYYRPGPVPLPGPNLLFPIRNAMAATCGHMFPPV